MKRLCTILAAALLAACARGAVPVEWTVDTARVAPVTLEAYHGETLQLAATLMRTGMPVTVGANTATFLWQTNGMGSAWWRTNATCSAAGVVSATFTPSMDTGANTVPFFFSIVDGSGTSYRASGRLFLRPSPGADPTAAELPQPGGTIDFSSVAVENAPWATLTAVDSAISAAVGPLCTVAAANALVASASNTLAQAIGAITVPSLAGYATEAWARQYVATNLPAAVSLAGYATETWVQTYVAAHPTTVDLSSYATKTYAENVASNAVANIQIPSLAGYVTETWARNYVATNMPSVDLSPYATKTYAENVASNAVAGIQIPSLSGYATETYVSGQIGAVETDIATVATRLESIRRLYADTNRITRLWAPDGSQVIDGTGCVWQVTHVAVTNWISASNGVEFVYRETRTHATDPDEYQENESLSLYDASTSYDSYDATLYVYRTVGDGEISYSFVLYVGASASTAISYIGGEDIETNDVSVVPSSIDMSRLSAIHDTLTPKIGTNAVYSLATRIAYTNDVLTASGGGSDTNAVRISGGTATNLTVRGELRLGGSSGGDPGVIQFAGNDSDYSTTWLLGMPGWWLGEYVFRKTSAENETIAFVSDIVAATNNIQATSARLWDATYQVEWQAKMVNGNLYYIAVTNVNTSASEE